MMSGWVTPFSFARKPHPQRRVRPKVDGLKSIGHNIASEGVLQCRKACGGIGDFPRNAVAVDHIASKRGKRRRHGGFSRAGRTGQADHKRLIQRRSPQIPRHGSDGCIPPTPRPPALDSVHRRSLHGAARPTPAVRQTARALFAAVLFPAVTNRRHLKRFVLSIVAQRRDTIPCMCVDVVI